MKKIFTVLSFLFISSTGFSASNDFCKTQFDQILTLRQSITELNQSAKVHGKTDEGKTLVMQASLIERTWNANLNKMVSSFEQSCVAKI